MFASNKKFKSSAAVLDRNRILMFGLRSGMTWSKAVENDKEQKELLMYFVFYFDSGYTISMQYVNGDLIPEAVGFCQATLPQPAVIVIK